jgi:flavin reductase (DIM6/NTAB) family NADH-FMN oxidoreductase RutF
MRADFDPAETGSRVFYRLLTALVVPRPIAWVSSRSAEGVDNLAPHSFFTVASSDPPMLAFTSVGSKDTLRNVRATGEFVVNLAVEPLITAVNETATDFPPQVGEFDAVGLRREPSALVAPPRVADSPAAFECRLHATLGLGNASTMIIGRVVFAAVDESVLVDGYPEVDLLRPLARLGRDEWSTIGEVSSVKRIKYSAWQQREQDDPR